MHNLSQPKFVDTAGNKRRMLLLHALAEELRIMYFAGIC